MSELGLGVPPAGPQRTQSAREQQPEHGEMPVSVSMPILPNERADLETADDKTLRQIATSDELPSDWPNLRTVIEGKIDQHIANFKLDENSLFDKAASPPWPMDATEIETAKSRVFTLLESFPCSASSAPFTIQRLAELALSPLPYYRSLPQYLRALTRCLRVTSDASVYPPSKEEAPQTNGFLGMRARSSSVSSTSSASSSSSSHSQHAMPQLSPIPLRCVKWLRERSASAEPASHEAITTSHLTLDEEPAKRQRLAPSDPLVAGRVDELDTQSTGNEMMADPVPLTSTTTSNGTTAVEGSLQSRFAPASDEDIGVAK